MYRVLLCARHGSRLGVCDPARAAAAAAASMLEGRTGRHGQGATAEALGPEPTRLLGFVRVAGEAVRHSPPHMAVAQQTSLYTEQYTGDPNSALE